MEKQSQMPPRLDVGKGKKIVLQLSPTLATRVEQICEEIGITSKQYLLNLIVNDSRFKLILPRRRNP